MAALSQKVLNQRRSQHERHARTSGGSWTTSVLLPGPQQVLLHHHRAIRGATAAFFSPVAINQRPAGINLTDGEGFNEGEGSRRAHVTHLHLPPEEEEDPKINSFNQSLLCFPPSPDRKRQIWSEVFPFFIRSSVFSLNGSSLMLQTNVSFCLGEALAVVFKSISICVMRSSQI